MRRIDSLPGLVPFRAFTDEDKVDQLKHINEDQWLYEKGQWRYICSILGTLHQELEAERPDLLPLILEAVWMARRMNDRGRSQADLDWNT